eukprot:6881035-Prymnesium_polylepis.1
MHPGFTGEQAQGAQPTGAGASIVHRCDETRKHTRDPTPRAAQDGENARARQYPTPTHTNEGTPPAAQRAHAPT